MDPSQRTPANPGSWYLRYTGPEAISDMSRGLHLSEKGGDPTERQTTSLVRLSTPNKQGCVSLLILELQTPLKLLLHWLRMRKHKPETPTNPRDQP